MASALLAGLQGDDWDSSRGRPKTGLRSSFQHPLQLNRRYLVSTRSTDRNYQASRKSQGRRAMSFQPGKRVNRHRKPMDSCLEATTPLSTRAGRRTDRERHFGCRRYRGEGSQGRDGHETLCDPQVRRKDPQDGARQGC